MFDELERLRHCPQLRQLLSHYADASGGGRSLWQDRMQVMAGVSTKELVVLHGELLAQGWIEQNTGVVEVLLRGSVPRCYRATGAGLRALASEQLPEDDERAA